jgi:hypothetical protein
MTLHDTYALWRHELCEVFIPGLQRLHFVADPSVVWLIEDLENGNAGLGLLGLMEER